MGLCAGAGGLELGIGLAVPGYRTVAWVEWDARAAASLVARMADEVLAPAPVWSDLRTFDGRRWRGCVDLVSAGFPCQPFSVAGSQRGHDDPRHLWPHVARVIGEVGCEWVFLENVPGLISTLAPDGRSAFDHVVGDLGELGYEVEAGIFSAAEVGAPHLRERVFILAHRASGGLGVARTSRWGGRRIDLGGSDVADAEPAGREVARDSEYGSRAPRSWEAGIHRKCGFELPVFPPGRNEYARWRAILAERPDLAPAVESGVRRVADGLAPGLDRSRLAILGNGVVPLVAGHALLTLAARLEARQ